MVFGPNKTLPNFVDFHKVRGKVVPLHAIQYTGCLRRNGPDFGRVFLMLNYTENPKTPISKVERFR